MTRLPVGKLPPAPWVALGRFKLNKVGVAGGQNRSGATPADVSELSQSAKKRIEVDSRQAVTRPLGE